MRYATNLHPSLLASCSSLILFQLVGGVEAAHCSVFAGLYGIDDREGKVKSVEERVSEVIKNVEHIERHSDRDR